MTIPEQIWFAVAISGFVLYMEGVITASFNIICFSLKRGKRRGNKREAKPSYLKRMLQEHLSRAGAGLVLYILGIINLNPSWLFWAVVGLVLLILAIACLINHLKSKI